MDSLLLSIFNLLIFSVVGVYLYRTYRGTLPEPDNTDLIFKARGGGSVSIDSTSLYYHLTWPFVIIHLYQDRLLLNYGGKKVNLLYSEITEVRLLLISGIEIRHNNPNQPITLRFWSWKKSKEIKKLIDERSNKIV
jgi:hypothetical protein